MPLSLLLTDLADLEPVAPGDAVAEAHRRQPPTLDAPEYDDLLSAGEFDDMALQRWGIVAPEGADGDAMLAAVAPLRAWREREMNASAVVLRIPPGLSRKAQRLWKHRQWQRLERARRPRYLLILGDLDQVPLTVQQSLMASACVGRLCFTNLDGSVNVAGYAAYSHKVIASEQLKSAHEHPRLLFYANRNLDDDALENHYAYVVKQCHKRARDNGDAPAEHIQRFGRPGKPQWDELGHSAEQLHPSVLVSLCHGAGETDPARQRERQGALVLAGARGKQVIDHSFFAGRKFLPDGFWLLNACFGAGTPAHSVYHPWLKKLAALSGERVTPAAAMKFLAQATATATAQQGRASGLKARVKANIQAKMQAKMQAKIQARSHRHLQSPSATGPAGRPFIARIPQVALANPEGPLGFLGHVDIVWGYGYRDALGGATADSSPYYGIVQALARGQRFGVAMRSLAEQAAALGLELAFLGDDTDPGRQLLRTRVWLQCWDLFGYILLGDPAARLPLRGSQTVPDQQAASEPVQETNVGPDATAESPVAEKPAAEEPAAGPPRGRQISVKAMQEAVFRCIRGEELASVAARLRVSPDDVERWRAEYTAAGRAALGRLATDGD